MKVRKAFGQRLRELRTAVYHLSQEELAFRCDMQASHIGQLERGEKSPTLDTLSKIATGMGIPLPQLVDMDAGLDSCNQLDDTTNKILAHLQPLSPAEKEQVLKIVKTFGKQ